MATQPKYLSVEEYLDQEEASLDRHEYSGGQVFAMAGGTPNHALICINILACFRSQLNAPCRVRGSDMRIRTSPSGLYSYADAVISCEPEQFAGTTLLNPKLIAEVLSESTKNYDRGQKFELYREIPSFEEYLVVAQDRIYVEQHVKSDSILWTMRAFSLLDDVIKSGAIEGLTLPIKAIYADVNFDSA